MRVNCLIKEICPKVCICDVFEGFKRADCSEQNLISPDINIAKSVEILNLSGNQIATIHNENFEYFIELINLSLAKNSIHSIELFAFSNLMKLAYLDLSENRLELIDNRIIENNYKLTVLDLSKNKFMMNLEDEPIIISKSLEFLSLRNSQLSHIYDSFFSEVPSLLDLDISSNLLITLKSTPFLPIDKLQFINLEYNSFTCDNQMDKTIQFLKNRKVFVKIDKCLNTKKPKMFEKMIMLTSPENDESKEDIEIDLVWGKNVNRNASNDNTNIHVSGMLRDYYMELKNNLEEESYCKNDDFATILCECRQNYILHYETTNRSHVVLKKNVEMKLNAVFYIGCVLGVIAGCMVFYCILIIKEKCKKMTRKQMQRQEMRDRVIREFNQEVREAPIPQTHTPLPAPRSSPIVRNRAQPTSSTHAYNPQSPQLNRQMRNEFSPTANLLHKLFRNREVQQYQPTTEISRSIFYTPSSPLPRRSSELVEFPRPSSSSQTIEIQPEMQENIIDENDSDSEYMSVNESLILEADRSSTPPPAYREIYE
ncbi:hypothetical protein PVAND_004498 [Polypedilum vanderplanki]|uniref:Uncharacterized protein n=1 Tax=Polypedilum vanderplanki TaxID=319348 RepID=A0A9J6BXW9_POLVA|nr:hypothetical protein PVAND_004498 [Polypedilum vanderplanki]